MKLVFAVKSAIVFIKFVIFIPSQTANNSNSIMILSKETITSSSLFSLSFEGVGCKPSFVSQSLRPELSCLSFSSIIYKFSIIIRSIFKDKCSLPMSLSKVEIANINTSIRFVHSSESMRSLLGLDNRLFTSSN